MATGKTQTHSTKSKAKAKKAKAKAKEEDHERTYSCEFCNRHFHTPYSLGGHVSKAHPKKSDTYKKKLLRRAERGPERELLGLAKQVFTRKYPGYEVKNHRQTVSTIKIKLRALLRHPDMTKEEAMMQVQKSKVGRTMLK